MSWAQLLALTPLLLVAALAVALMLLAAFRGEQRLQFWLYQLGLLAALLSVLPSSASAIVVTPLLRIDGFFAFFAQLFIVAAMAIGVMAAQYWQRPAAARQPAAEVYVLLALCLLGALVLAAAQHFAALFIGLELIAVASFALVAYPAGATAPLARSQRRSLEAGIKYLLLSAVASAFLLFGIACLYLQQGTLAFVDVRALTAPAALPASVLLPVGAALLLIGAAFKLSIVPFHMWTPDVYQGAPTPVTALIATLSKGALVAALLRYLHSTELLSAPGVGRLLIALAALSMLGGNLLALMQHNIKRLLAYSSIAHIGYLLVAFIAVGLLGGGNELALQASAFYLVAYVVTTLGAFAIVNVVSDGAGELRAFELRHYRGLFWRSPWLASCFILILLSLAGIPLTIGFVGKFYVFAAGAEAQLWLALTAVIVGSAIGLYYYLQVILVMLQPAQAGAAVPAGSHWLAYSLTGVLLGFGVYPAPIMAWLPAL